MREPSRREHANPRVRVAGMETRMDRHLTARDLDDLPHEWDTLYELIGGVLFVSRKPSYQHQRIVTSLLLALGPTVRALGGDVVAEPGLVWDEDGDDNVSPDIAVLLGARPPKGAKLRTCPEIVIEVLSPGAENRKRDLEAKRDLYWRQGAKEYWILDPEANLLIQLTRGSVQWKEERLSASDLVRTPLLSAWPGVTVEELLA